jgi:hypothetical protein
MGAQQAKLDAHLRTLSSLGSPSIHYVLVYYPFAPEDGGRSAPMALLDLDDRLAIIIVAAVLLNVMPA